ncbi:MAG: glycosyltransferase family 9 protein [bacterium]|nr:glycosyltransferase family 9 protein [bacterium]
MGFKWKRYFRLRRWVKSISFFLSDPIAPLITIDSDGRKHLLLIKTEAIGDYILFRNFLQSVRESEAYKDHHISLIGNEIWKPLFQKLDLNYVDTAYFINRNLFMTVASYRKDFFNNFNTINFNAIVNCTHSREFLLGDLMVRALASKNKIGMEGDSVSEIPPLKLLGNTFYTRLIGSNRNNYFEFARNKHFFEQLLSTKISLNYPQIEHEEVAKKFVVMLPGAQDKVRQWPSERFKELAQKIHDVHGYEIILSGSAAEKAAAELILDAENAAYIKNFCGVTALGDLPKLLAGAVLAICNDSGTLHMAAALNVPTVCISNGNHYGRFSPYPEAKGRKLAFLYPPSFLAEYESEDARRKEMAFGSRYTIASIGVEEAWLVIERILND